MKITDTTRNFCNALFDHEHAKAEFTDGTGNLVAALLQQETIEWQYKYNNWCIAQDNLMFAAKEFLCQPCKSKQTYRKQWMLLDTEQAANTVQLWNMLPRRHALMLHDIFCEETVVAFWLGKDIVAYAKLHDVLAALAQ